MIVEIRALDLVPMNAEALSHYWSRLQNYFHPTKVQISKKNKFTHLEQRKVDGTWGHFNRKVGFII